MFFDTPTNEFGEKRGKGCRVDLRMLSHVETYWRGLIGDAQIPRRSDIDPSALGEALSNTLILERVAPGMARVRLAGQTLNRIFGMDVRGMPASILVAPASRKDFAAQVEAMFAGPAIVELPLQMARGWGRKPMKARLLMLPLTDGYGAATRAIAVLAVEGATTVQSNSKFDMVENGALRCTVVPRPATIEPSRPAPLHAHKPARKTGTAPGAMPNRRAIPLFGVVEGGTSYEKRLKRAPEPSETRPALRLVVSNDA